MDENRSEVDRLVDVITGDLRDHERRIIVLEKNDVEKGVKIDHLSRTLEKIENNTTWTFRAVVGALIAGAIGLLFTLAKGAL